MAKYDINFGGRREFCQQTYADLGEFIFVYWKNEEKKIKNNSKIFLHLDNTSQEYQAQCSAPPVSNSNSKDLSFEELLSITKQKIGTTKKIRLTWSIEMLVVFWNSRCFL